MIENWPVPLLGPWKVSAFGLGYVGLGFRGICCKIRVPSYLAQNSVALHMVAYQNRVPQYRPK